MLQNVKSTFSPKPEILQKAAQGKQVKYNGFLLCLLDIVMGVASFLGEGILMFAVTFVLAFCSVRATGSPDYKLSGDASMIINLLITVGATIVCMLYVKFGEKRPISSMGFVKKNAVKDYLLGMLAAFAMFSACIGICVVTGAMKFDCYVLGGNYIPLVLILVGYVIQGMSEETMCRGFMMTSLGGKMGAVFGMLFNSILFAALHLMNSGITALAFINLILFGVFMSLTVLKLNSIWLACAIHTVWNFVQGNFYGVLVSGIDSGSSVFRFTSTEGMDVINGGSFGMEGGIATTIVLSVSIIIFLLIKPRTSENALTE